MDPIPVDIGTYNAKLDRLYAIERAVEAEDDLDDLRDGVPVAESSAPFVETRVFKPGTQYHDVW